MTTDTPPNFPPPLTLGEPMFRAKDVVIVERIPTGELRWIGAEYDSVCAVMGMAPRRKLQQRWRTNYLNGKKPPEFEWVDVPEIPTPKGPADE